jgi:hypothetical protein
MGATQQKPFSWLPDIVPEMSGIDDFMQKIQPRNTGPGIQLASQGGGAGYAGMAPASPRASSSSLTGGQSQGQSGQNLPLGTMMRMAQNFMGSGSGAGAGGGLLGMFSTPSEAASMMPGFTSVFDSAAPSLFGGALSGGGAASAGGAAAGGAAGGSSAAGASGAAGAGAAAGWWMLPLLAAASMTGVAAHEGNSLEDIFGAKGWGGPPFRLIEAAKDGDWGEALQTHGGPIGAIGNWTNGDSWGETLRTAIGAPLAAWDWIADGGDTMDLIRIFASPGG